MFLTDRAHLLPALIWLAGAVGLLGIGCAANSKDAPASGPATRPATTRASTKPVNETVVVDVSAELGPFAPRARGVLRPPPSAQIAPAKLAPLGPLAEGRGGDPAPAVRATLTELVKFDGAFPGEKGDWTKWDAGVADLVNRLKSGGRPVAYEVARDPDNKASFKGRDRYDFLSAYVRSVRIIRRVDPGATVVGPSLGKNDHGWVQEFLKVGKEYDALPDVVSWSEDNLKHDIAGHVGQMADTFWQDGSAIPRVALSASAAVAGKYAASDPPIFMGQMEKSAKDNAWRPVSVEFEFKLSHLFTAEPEGKPRSVFYAWREYAALAGAGRSVKVSSTPTIDGVAVWSGPQRTARALVGRNKSRVDAKHVLGKVTFQVKGAAGATVLMKATRIADTGAKPSAGPERTWEVELPLKNGEASCPLPDFAPGDAYAIELTVRGQAPSTKPTTSATKPVAAAAKPERPTPAPAGSVSTPK
jgi:hypothetical protein